MLVEEPLRRWCRESLGYARRQFAKETPTQAKWTAESVVDTAAFRNLLSGRKINGTVPFDSEVAASSRAIDLVNSLASECPIDVNSSPEILGSIHETLVTLRRSRRNGSAPRGSSSRKANGIFYTPSFIVDEIVQQTIGPRLTERIHHKRDRIRVLDPAAGCGAFLVAAFRFLMRRSQDDGTSNASESRSNHSVQTENGGTLTYRKCQAILKDHLFGVDLDPTAIEVARRVLWLTMIDFADWETLPNPIDFFPGDLSANIKSGQTLIGSSFLKDETEEHDESTPRSSLQRFDWASEFPHVAMQGGFDVVLGNPPYRRERDFKQELDEIQSTALGRKHRSARMDLWYYFLHRGIELLRDGGSLSFITNAYWIQGRGAEKVIATLRDDVHLDEVVLLGSYPVFPGISGQHLIFRVTKSHRDDPITIKMIPRGKTSSTCLNLSTDANMMTFVKSKEDLFCDGRLDVMPSADALFQKLRSQARLIEFGLIRQGIAENPAAINRRTLERFHEESLSQKWIIGEGVFSLRASEVARLALPPTEAKLLRPYHDLCDLSRYWNASPPSRQLLYSTRQTCPEITDFPTFYDHISRFRAVLDARRETRQGTNSWWHLHWPRDARIWQADKLIALQLAVQPSFVPIFGPAYVPFSANVFVPFPAVRESLYYFCGVLNSRILWAWFAHTAKRRGVGLELNGHTLENAPIRRIDFDNLMDVCLHDELVQAVTTRIELETDRARETLDDSCRKTIADDIVEIELRLDSIVASLYGLSPENIATMDEIVSRERFDR